MNKSSFLSDGDEDQDSLFGSPPPSPARGRSPSRGTFTTGDIRPTTAVPRTGVGRENVGTIALPGSHMSCAELPADLPASSSSLPRPISSYGLSSVAPPSITGKHTSLDKPIVTSRSSSRSVTSKISSAPGTIPSASARKRRTPKSKSVTPIPPAPPIALPGPDEPTPPNFLRSQSSLLGLAGLVGCVKPAQLYTRSPQPIPHSRPHSPIRGLTPTHPIVLDDDQGSPHTRQRNCGHPEMPQSLDQLDPEMLRSNIMNSLTKEKNIFPVLQSLIKLFGGEPRSPDPPPQLFARPYGHGTLNAQPSPLVSTYGSSTTPTVPPLKRRKLKHVPAGAIDWDVPFPFATGEGPEAYRDTWARDRAKQLVTQLLELVQNAAKRAAVKTAKNTARTPKRQTMAGSSQPSRSASVETQIGRIGSCMQTDVESSSRTSWSTGDAVPGTPMDSLDHFLGSINLSAPASWDGVSVDSGGVVGGGGSALSCDYSAFEEWLSQLQQFAPSETPTPESDWGARPSVSACSSTPDMLVPMQCDTLTATHSIRDEAIDPTLLALSQQVGSASQSSTSPSPLDIPQMVDMSSTPPALVHSRHTSLSSSTEPLTPLSEACTDVPISRTTHSNLVDDLPTPRSTEKEKDQPTLAPLSESPRITTLQKGKARADSDAPSVTSVSSRSTPTAVSTSKGNLDKRAILERAQERRRQLVAEIERAKIEIWEMTLENAVLVHYMRDKSSNHT